MTEEEKMKRNLNPTPEAVIAMYMWAQEYSEQRGGSMDFWDKLSKHRKNVCINCLQRIHAAERARKRS